MKLGDYSALVRAKNAGPFTITIDIIFKNKEDMQKVVDSGEVGREKVAILFDVKDEDLAYFNMEGINSIKFSFPRSISSGSVGDNDVFGCQSHAKIVDIEIP